MKLPSDIQKYVRKQMTKKGLLFLFYSALAALVLKMVIPSLSRHLGVFEIVLLCLGSFFIAAYFSKVLLLVFDRDWSGKIVDIKVETKTGSYSRHGKTAICERNTILLIVEKENGKTVTITAETFVSKSDGGENIRIGHEYDYAEHVLRGKPEDFLKKYHVGDAVYHFRGLPRNLYLSARHQSLIKCIVCGTENDVAKDTCYQCAHSLIKPL